MWDKKKYFEHYYHENAEKIRKRSMERYFSLDKADVSLARTEYNLKRKAKLRAEWEEKKYEWIDSVREILNKTR